VRMDVQHSHFLNLAPILGRMKSSIPHGTWRFYFFSTFFTMIRIHQDLSYQLLGFLFNEKMNSLKIHQELLV
jgi:hypothetical protein